MEKLNRDDISLYHLQPDTDADLLEQDVQTTRERYHNDRDSLPKLSKKFRKFIPS